ncbi:hypothetical protein NKH77_09440 [Streptomyces sp. M19]
MTDGTITTADPATGVVTATALRPSTDEEVAEACARAARATAELAALGRPFRAALLRRMADALDAGRPRSWRRPTGRPRSASPADRRTHPHHLPVAAARRRRRGRRLP